MNATITKTRTVGGIKWEYTEEEGLWFSACGVYHIGRSGRKGRRSEWVIAKHCEEVWFAKSCGELMEMVAIKHI